MSEEVTKNASFTLLPSLSVKSRNTRRRCDPLMSRGGRLVWMWRYSEKSVDDRGKPVTTMRLSGKPIEGGERVRVRWYGPRDADPQEF
jgi:hypothetical protein